MGTLAYFKHDGLIANTAKEAFEMLVDKKKHSVCMYSSTHRVLASKLNELSELIKEHNKTISEPNDQIVASNPYFWDDIDGCLGVQCAEVTAGKVSDMMGGISFTGWNTSVLVKKDIKVGLNDKALTTLALMGSFYT